MRLAPMRLFCALFFLASAMIQSHTAAAADLLANDRGAAPQDRASSFIDEARFGILVANLEDGDHGGDYAINGELLFRPIAGPYDNPVLDLLFTPRPHLGASISPDGVNQVYAGLTWDLQLTNSIFIESSFGAAAHDGETSADDPDSYGCSVQFRESASLGVKLSEHLKLMATVDHMSNAGLCDGNQGLTNAGVRLGYQW